MRELLHRFGIALATGAFCSAVWGNVVSEEIAAYRDQTGISEPSALQIQQFVDELQASGVEPAFLWLGGELYNQDDQSAAVIGADGIVVGSGEGIQVAGDHAAFQRGNYLSFPQPDEIRAELRDELVFAIWYRPDASSTRTTPLLSFFADQARGPVVELRADGRVSASFRPHATSELVASVFPVGATAQAVTGRRFWGTWIRNDGVHADHLSEIGLRRDRPMPWPIANGIFNDHDRLSVGGLLPTPGPGALGGQVMIDAVVVGQRMVAGEGVPANAALSKVSSALVRAGIHDPIAPSQPAVFTMGDSTTATGWNQYLSGANSAAQPHAGAWAGNCVVADFAIWGYNINQLIALTPEYVGRISNAPYQKRILIYTCEPYSNGSGEADDLGVEDREGWYAATSEWMQSIEEQTGCEIVLASYLNGWRKSGTPDSGEVDRNYVEQLCVANGWRFVDLWEDPHSRVWGKTYDETVSYGFYQDDSPSGSQLIHLTDEGKQILAERVASYLSHPTSPAPRLYFEQPPAIVRDPLLKGELSEDEVLFCTTGGWFNAPESFSFQWLANLKPIAGANSATYTVKGGLLGRRLACRVTAHKTGQPNVSFTSAPTERVCGDAEVSMVSHDPYRRVTIDRCEGKGLLEFNFPQGLRYFLRASDDLEDPDTFDTLLEFTGTGVATLATFEDLESITKGRRFYQIVEVAEP